MRVAHFDCFSGISGDMVLAAAVDAGASWDAIVAAIDSLKLPITMELERVKRCGFAATKVNVLAKDEENYRFLPDVQAIINLASLTDRQKDLAIKIFEKVAVAEATVHGMPLERVHFHEVGALDSIADILGAAVALDLLQVEAFTSSSVATGSGTVKCAHGIMPVPTPGTVELLKGVPLAKSNVKGELTTPTGAAILTTVVSAYTDTPSMRIDRIGTGAGTKDFIEQPNILRLFIGEQQPPTSAASTIVLLETNLDDVSAELVGYTTELLLQAGALDVFTQAILMKKQRPGVLLSVIAVESTVHVLESILFRETGTLGIRRSVMQRSVLPRETKSVNTPWGTVRVKLATLPDGKHSTTPEYEDCAAIARTHQIPLREVYSIVNAEVREERAK